MAFMKGKAAITKVAALAKYGVLPGTMVFALLHSPPNYNSSSNKHAPATSNYPSDFFSNSSSISVTYVIIFLFTGHKNSS
ncbi:hypothetical protein VNO78_21569 [Psophocarpus tetragonolobus]|uniref:Uncharacterized protein n=1 Tax=Psophocarpus tetragonolobus TaxID=3891 RepID=A0AAN9XI72_PSOTE